MKKPHKILITGSILFYAGISPAFSDPCLLKNTKLPASINLDTDAINVYYEKLQYECNLKNQYEDLDKKAASKGISLTDIKIFQALRYVKYADFISAGGRNTPVQKIYQIKDETYKLPMDQQSSLIWDNFIKGISQVPVWEDKIKNGQQFKLQDLQTVHKGFFSLSDEEGDHSRHQEVGTFKTPSDNDSSWWSFSSNDELINNKVVIDLINSNYKKFGIIDASKDSNIYNVLRIKNMSLYGGDTRAANEHVNKILSVMNQIFQQGGNNQHLMINNILLTPSEAAYMIQQFYVQVHPFYEGNGRTSRFLQELILTTFNMPPGASGYLMDSDILSTNAEYYKLAIESQKSLLDEVAGCFDEYKQHGLKNKNKIENTSNILSYKCQLIE